MRAIGVAISISAASAVPVHAADATGSYTDYLGVSCGQYVQERGRQNGNRYWQLDGYIRGYVTAYNNVTPKTLQIVPDIESAALWLENYCRAHPLVNLAAGLEALTTEAYPNRKQAAPK